MDNNQEQLEMHSIPKESCPHCNNGEAYRLSDGRYKCKLCKKKFTPNRKKSRVPEEIVKALARQFWELKTAEQCAQSLGINRKTAQSYYARIRRGIAAENLAAFDAIHTVPPTATAADDKDMHTVFWALLHDNLIRIVFPEQLNFSLQEDDLPDSQGLSLFYSNSLRAKTDIIIDKFYRRTLWARKETDAQKLQDFWRYSKINLMKYRGGSKSRFPHFITEMAFRFNHQEREDVFRFMEALINDTSSNTQTKSFGR